MNDISGKSKLFLKFWKAKKNEHSRSYVSLFLANQKAKRTRLGSKDYA
jgi:hypothetical protein